MVLNNYWKWLNGVTTIPSYVPGRNPYSPNLGIVSIEGSTWGLYWGTNQTGDGPRTNVDYTHRLDTNLGIVIGQGSNTYTANSYCLASDITSFFNVSCNYASTGNEGFSKIITITGHSNEGSYTHNITEFGVYKQIMRDNGVTYDKYLFAICQLNTPLVVPPMSDFIVTLNWLEA